MNNEKPVSKTGEARPWRLWQLESSFACNLNCVMCPWSDIRREPLENQGLMSDAIWDALRPFLPDVEEIDFSGGGEPLLQSNLPDWIREAKDAGCKTGFLTNGTLLDAALTEKILNAGVDWVGFSADGGTRETFEKIRRGASFETFCENVRGLTRRRNGKHPWVLLNVVMMRDNIEELEPLVQRAAELGIDQVNFKQCDVVRGDRGKNRGLFASKADREIRSYMKALNKACKLARKRGLKTQAFSFTPEELPVCAQDPRGSLFIRYDGVLSPCISLSMGGPVTFMGEAVEMPSVHYGQLPEDNLADVWMSAVCRSYRDGFENRIQAHDASLSRAHFEPSLIKLEEAFETARKAMPSAPDGCRVCHYLYDV